MYKHSLMSISAVLALALMTGCASVPMATPEADAQAKTFKAPADKANLYIYRNESFGSAVKMTVLLDNQLAGDTGPHTYILKSVAPGSHTLTSKTENDATLTIDAAAGKNYYVWQEVKMGALSAGSQLHLVDDTAGQAGVQDCKLVQ
ncbi:MAG TPA: DUF2846 domain-containing protein [Nevskiaceae bacterium]|nr:DUF2846 domain-containing protein [Nevskiaceae bacterium]